MTSLVKFSFNHAVQPALVVVHSLLMQNANLAVICRKYLFSQHFASEGGILRATFLWILKFQDNFLNSLAKSETVKCYEMNP